MVLGTRRTSGCHTDFREGSRPRLRCVLASNRWPQQGEKCPVESGCHRQPPGQPGHPANGTVVPGSPAPTWNNSINVLLFLEREKNLMPPGEVDGLELGEDSLDEERKIPLKLMRRGERGGDSW